MLTRGLPAAEALRRVPMLVGSFALIGLAVGLMVRADLGLGPWDVLHQGISDLTGIAMGTTGILVGFVVLLTWIPLKVRPGIGTVLNVILIGVSVDVALWLLPEATSLGLRWAELLVGALLFGPGIALYLSCELGAGPRDGVMEAFVERGHSRRIVRTVMEVTVLIAGWILGGTVGVGTVLFAFTIGPNLHWWTEWLDGRGDGEIVPAALAD